MSDPELSPSTTLVDSDSADTLALHTSNEVALELVERNRLAFLTICLRLDAKGISERYFRHSKNPRWIGMFHDNGAWNSRRFQHFLFECQARHYLKTYDQAGTGDELYFKILPPASAWVETFTSHTSAINPASEVLELFLSFLRNDDETNSYWKLKEETVRHLQAISQFIEHSHQDFQSQTLLDFSVQAAHRMSDQGYYTSATTLLTIIHQHTSPSFAQALQAQNEVAVILDRQGNHQKAEKLLLSIAKEKTKVFGQSHDFTFQALDDLANTHYNRGNLGLAAQVLKELIDLKTGLYGSTHANTLLSQNNLAVVYVGQGKYHTAQMMFSFVLAEREKLISPRYLDLAISSHNLGAVHADQGFYDQATTYFKRALAIREDKLGPQHPTTLSTLNALGMAMAQQGSYHDAETMLVQALSIAEASLGVIHPFTLKSRESLGVLYGLQGMHDLAEPHLQQSWETLVEAKGVGHPDTLSAARNLAYCQQQQDLSLNQ